MANDVANDVAEKIAKYKGLLDSGALTQQEFDALKAKALSEELGKANIVAVKASDETASETSMTTENVSLEPVRVEFTIEGDRVVPHVKGADSSQFEDGYTKPAGQDVRSFCSDVAETMEGNLGRPVRWTFVEAGTKRKDVSDGKGNGVLRLVAIAVAIVAVAILGWNMFSSQIAYKGDVKGLVANCQAMRESDKKTVEVSGYVCQAEKDGACEHMVLTPDGISGGFRARVRFEEPQEIWDGEWVTVRGTVSGKLVSKVAVSVTEAEVVRKGGIHGG